jgi:hypothetical protein
VSSSVCLPCQPSAIPAIHPAPVRQPKRFTITHHVSKLNQPRITVTDNTACITSSYTYTTAQNLVKELATALGMLACTQQEVMEMLHAQTQGNPVDRI